MVWAFHALARAVRRSPNVYSFIGGWFLMLGAPIYVVLTFASSDIARSGNAPQTLLFAVLAKVGEYLTFDPSYVGIPVALVVIVGFIMVLAGITRAFRPRGS
jgi:hypothetical protein